MTKQNRIEELEQQLESQGNRLVEKAAEIDKLKERLREAIGELNHYRTAVAAVKWLWDRAGNERPFQL